MGELPLPHCILANEREGASVDSLSRLWYLHHRLPLILHEHRRLLPEKLPLEFTQVCQQAREEALGHVEVPRELVKIELDDKRPVVTELAHGFVSEDMGDEVADVLAHRLLPVDVVLQNLHVLLGEESHALAVPAIASSTADLLDVAFQASWHVVVDDCPHVGLVDTHTERDRCDHSIHLSTSERILHLLPHIARQAGMVRADVVVPPEAGAQCLGQGHRGLLPCRVDDTRDAPLLAEDCGHLLSSALGGPVHVEVVRPGVHITKPSLALVFGTWHPLPDLLFHLEALARIDDSQLKIRPVEPRPDDRVEVELAPQIRLDVAGAGGRQQQHAHVRRAVPTEVVNDRREFQVVGPERVPPLGNAVGLVDRKHGDRNALDQGEKAFVREALRRDEQELQLRILSLDHVQHIPRLEVVETAVQGHRGAWPDEVVDLVLHERD
mmetsp:Transcript_15082/g.36962  ORF Transcript_15082/g.36962 Transcript_15082/m.36962 type:complete len:439 (+) Transcript_15082:902-2218(+)